MPWAPDETGQWQWYASPLLAPQAGAQPGQSAWNQDPTGTGPAQGDATQANYGQPITTNYNPMYSATDTQAQTLAQQLGGQVVSAPMREAGGGTPGSTFSMPATNYIRMPNGAMLNAGEVSQWAGQYGQDSQQFKTMVAQETAGGAQDAQGGGEGAQGGAANWYQQFGQSPAVGASAGGPTASTWYQNPQTSQWQYGLPPAGAATSSGGTDPTGGQLGPGATPPAAGAPGATATPPLGSGYQPKPLASTGNTPDATSFAGVTNYGGYGIGQTGGGSGGNGAVPGSDIKDANGNVTKAGWGYNPSTNIQDTLSNDRKFAYTQGQSLIGNYGDQMAAQDQRARSLGSTGDELYSWMLANPGYTQDQAAQIMNSGLDANGKPSGVPGGGLAGLSWTDQMAQSNFLNQGEQAGIQGDPNAALNNYNANVEGLRGDARNYQGQLQGIYDTGSTGLNTAAGGESQRLDNAIDPSQLGLSSTYQQQHQFGPEDQQALIEDAGRTVGQGTAAVTDQLQRDANAAGTNAPLAMSAALDRQRQTGAVASADAMTKAKIQAAQLGLTAGQEAENTRLGAAQDISSRQMSAATTMGQQDAANQQFLTAGRASAGLQTGAAGLAESNTIANQQSQLAGSADVLAQQRAQAIAQNRQQTNQANQSAQFTRGSYQDTAQSQRATQDATASRNDLTSARQDVRNEEQTANNESNSRMAGQLQAFTGTTGAGQASQQNAITAAQMPSTIQKIVGGLTSYGAGGVATEPTMARLGELGPEIVIKLKPSKPMQYQRRGEMASAA